jgi:arabinan endo-1,5-alpha-L-arabinosidase
MRLWYGTYDASIINYWPVEAHNQDLIETAHLQTVQNRIWANDRFDSPLSSMRITDSTNYLMAPPRVYFSGDLTVTVWAKPNGFRGWGRIIDFGNGQEQDNIIFSVNNGNANSPAFVVRIIDQVYHFDSPRPIPLNQWSFLAATLSGTTLKIFINGIQTNIITDAYIPRNVLRSVNYIGKSHWVADAYANADFDELKIHNRALSQQEIIDTMRLNYPYLIEI